MKKKGKKKQPRRVRMTPETKQAREKALAMVRGMMFEEVLEKGEATKESDFYKKLQEVERMFGG